MRHAEYINKCRGAARIFAKYLLGLCLCMSLGVAEAGAQIIKMTAEAPSVVEVGERFNLVYTVSISDASPTAALRNAEFETSFPTIRGFTVVNRNPYRSQSSQISTIQGKMQSSQEVSFTFVLQAEVPGRFTIDAASCKIKGATYTSNSLSIEVVQGNRSGSGSQTPSGSGSAGANARSNADAQAQNSGSGNSLYFRVQTSKRTAYQGEALTAQVKLFAKVSVSSLQALNLPSFEGFYKQEVTIPPLTKLTRENVDGEVYGTGVLTKYVLFPQKTGNLTIGAATMDVEFAQRVQSSPGSFFGFDDFFLPQTQYVTRTLTSPEVTVNVLPLPTENRPAGFNGAVGQFTLKAQMDKTSLKANETATLKLTLSGKGNLKLFNMPKGTLPPDFDTYDPKVTNNIQDDGITGTKTAEYLMIPRHEGTYVIPALTFSYFDPQAAAYRTLTTESFTLNVEKGDELLGGTSMVSGLSREDLKFLGQDIHYIHTRPQQFTGKDRIFLFSGRFFAWILALAGLFLLTVLLSRRHIRRNADETARRYRHAGRAALKRLRTARDAMHRNEVERFYEEVSKALWGFLSDKLSIPVAELSRSTAEEAMRARGTGEETIQAFGRLIDTCEMARYAPSAVSHDLKAVYSDAARFISKV
ncbi:MAG: protein BatD [Bacteroidales bacterium]|nr:protein BatD [Bacteroidales bacterium]